MGLVDDKIKYKEYIAKANQTEQRYGLPTNLLVGLIKTESNFNPNAVSPAGAVGIAQFMPGTAKDFGIDPRNVDQSIDAAGKYLSQNYKKLGDWDDTLRSYNMGLGNVYKWRQGKMNLPKETAEYVGKIRSNMGGNSGGYYGGADQGYTGEIYRPQNIPSMNPDGTNNITPTAAAEEDTPEEKEAKREIEKVTAEKESLQDFYNQQQQATAPQQQEQYQQPVEEAPSLLEQYGQVSQFVDTPLAQIGGFIKDNRGQWAHPLQNTEISSPHITMEGVNYPVLGISKETGEKKMMMPNQNYYFEDTQNVLEIPQLKNYFNKK